MTSHDPHQSGVQVTYTANTSEEDFLRGERTLSNRGSRAAVATVEVPLQRVGISLLFAFLLGALVAVIWKANANLQPFLAVAGLLFGIILAIPLRYALQHWQRNWWWCALPTPLLFVAIIYFVGNAQFSGAFSGLMLTTLASSLIMGIVRADPPIEPVEEIPSLPDEPVWPPDKWTKETWERWWNALIDWNVYQEKQRDGQAPLPRLSPPPSGELNPGPWQPAAVQQKWYNWFREYQQWRAMVAQIVFSTSPPAYAVVSGSASVPPASAGYAPSAAPAGSPVAFPATWKVQSGPGPFYCAICSKTTPLPVGRQVAQCPGPEFCRQIICRECLTRNRDYCPVCSYREH
jgi:hypothetical protein